MADPTIKILFEDDSLIAINKEAGHLVHPADKPQPEDVVCMKLVRDFLGQHIYPTHRLDRPTCGVLLFAKNKTVARALNRAFERKQVTKIYHSIVAGRPKLDEWTCDQPLQKESHLPWKQALTTFRILAHLPHLPHLQEEFTLLEARPTTGRYHQIRKHLSEFGHPIVGDYRYAGPESCEKWAKTLNTGTRILLQCHCLIALHPITQKKLSIQAPEEECFRHN